MVKCDRCRCEISAEDSYQYLGKTLCESCYIDMRDSPKACDPWAVYSANRSRASQGIQGTGGLTSLQRRISDFVKDNSKVTREKLIEKFNLSEPKLQTQLATLRHCELVKGYKENGEIYLVLFD